MTSVQFLTKKKKTVQNTFSGEISIQVENTQVELHIYSQNCYCIHKTKWSAHMAKA